MAQKNLFRKVRIEGMYSLDDGFIPFADNPHHGKTFENVTVEIKKEKRPCYDFEVEFDVIRIGGNNPLEIECELVKKTVTKNGTLVLQICQDWG